MTEQTTTPTPTLSETPPAKPKRPRPKKLKKVAGPFQTACTFFEKGKHREIEVTITQYGVEYRLKGRQDSYLLPHDSGFQKALSIAVGFSTEARGSSRIKRGEFKLGQ